MILAAGRAASKADPGPHSDIDMYKDGHTVANAPRLPLNLLDALRAYAADATLATDFPQTLLALKHKEWAADASHFTAWETRTTLDV